MIRDAIEDSITWPVRKIIPIIPGDYRQVMFLLIVFFEGFIYISLFLYAEYAFLILSMTLVTDNSNREIRICQNDR